MNILPQQPGGPSSLLSDLLHARMCGGMGDMLLIFLDFGIGYGMGLPLERPADPIVAAMLDQTLDRWHREYQSAISWNDANEAPEWLKKAQEASV